MPLEDQQRRGTHGSRGGLHPRVLTLRSLADRVGKPGKKCPAYVLFNRLRGWLRFSGHRGCLRQFRHPRADQTF